MGNHLHICNGKGLGNPPIQLLTYNLNISGNHIAITASFDDESSAKGMVNDLIVKGFASNYFFLPNQSNSKEEIYKVFIGPYESLEEVNQWKQNVNGKVEIGIWKKGELIKREK